MNRGMTILELLLALALVSGIAVAALAWTQAAVRTSAATAARLRWESAASATLELIGDLLTSGEELLDRGDEPRVVAWAASLAVRAGPGPDGRGFSWTTIVFDHTAGEPKARRRSRTHALNERLQCQQAGLDQRCIH